MLALMVEKYDSGSKRKNDRSRKVAVFCFLNAREIIDVIARFSDVYCFPIWNNKKNNVLQNDGFLAVLEIIEKSLRVAASFVQSPNTAKDSASNLK